MGFEDSVRGLAAAMTSATVHEHEHFAVGHESGDERGMHTHMHAHPAGAQEHHYHPDAHDAAYGSQGAQDQLRPMLPREWQDLLDEQRREYERKLAEWERHAPQRQAAEQAAERALRRREAELGQQDRGAPVFAALDYLKPERPSWLG
jgi:hypothetical protein